jgi:hypothetical protein
MIITGGEGMLNRLIDELAGLGRNILVSIFSLAVGILMLYLVANNAEGIWDFISPFS